MVALISGLLMMFLLVQAYNKPFKNSFVNVLDCWLMLNLSLQYFAIWYATKNKPYLTLIVNILPTLFVITCIMVIAYHVAYVCGFSNKLIQAYCRLENLIIKHLLLHSRSTHTFHENAPLINDSDSFRGSFSDLREPALSL